MYVAVSHKIDYTTVKEGGDMFIGKKILEIKDKTLLKGEPETNQDLDEIAEQQENTSGDEPQDK